MNTGRAFTVHEPIQQDEDKTAHGTAGSAERDSRSRCTTMNDKLPIARQDTPSLARRAISAVVRLLLEAWPSSVADSSIS